MRNLVKIISMVVIFAGLGFYLSHASKKESLVARAPASLPSGKIIVNAPDEDLSDKSFTAYHFERSVHAELQEKSVKPLLNMKLGGTVFVTELSHSAGSRLVQLQFALTQGAAPEIHESHVPFIAEISNDQKIISLKTGLPVEKSDEDDFNVMKDFVSLYAYGSDRDTFGTYQFKLSRTGNEIEKKKIKYENASQAVTLKLSQAHAEVNASSAVWEKGQGHEEMRMEGMGAHSTLVTSSFYLIEKISNAGLARPKVAGNLVNLSETTLALSGRPQVEVKPWAELRAELAQIKKMSRSQRLSLFHELTKLLKTDPKVVAEFKAYIESMSKETGFMTFGIGVLATAGSGPAQAVLREWYAGSYGVEHTVLNAFTTASAKFTPDTRDFLNGIVGKRASDPELAQNAVFALGSSLKQGLDPEAQKSILGYYAQSKTEADRLNALDAIGNSGDANFLPTLRDAMKSDNASERERAVFAVRYLPADSAAPIIKSGYESGDAGLKKASLRALAFQQTLAPHAAVIRECAQAGEQVCAGLLARLNDNSDQ